MAPDDESFLDELLERAVDALAEGTPLDPDALAAGRPHLRDRIRDTLRLAGEVAVQRPALDPRVPGYELVRELGRGAMGTVWLARQLALGGRPVALKIPPPALAAAPETRRRFLEEARALSRLRHPHVVAVHDVVQDGSVLAYAMEWVEGRSWAALLEDLRLAGPRVGLSGVASSLGAAGLPDADLVRFHARVALEVARALDAVHAAGLLHRDVKPSNVLVRADGRALLSDFGLARASEDPLGTRTGAFLGTAAYAAPEQLEGRWREVDGRADVYGLGVSLYQALAGALPFPGRTPGEILLRIREGFVVPLRRAAPRLPRDLAVIAGKAMEAERPRRYAGASALADDLERFLAGRPILARPPSATYRFARLAGRHRAPFALLAALILALFAFGLSMAALSGRLSDQAGAIAEQAQDLEEQRNAAVAARADAQAEADRARLEGRRHQRMAQVFVDTFEHVDTYGGGADVRVSDVLGQAVDRARAELGDDPLVRGPLLSTLGESYAGLGRYGRAEPLLAEAVALLRETPGAAPRDLARTLLRYGYVLQERGRLDEAEAPLREAQAIVRALDGEESDAYAGVLNGLGRWREARGEYAEAEALFRRAVAICEELGEEGERALADVLQNLAAIRHLRGDPEAVPLFRRALALHERFLGEEHVAVAIERSNFASALSARGELAEAEELLAGAIEVMRTKLGPTHPHVGVSLANLARLLHTRGRSAEAEPHAREAVATLRAALGDRSADTGIALVHLGAVQIAVNGGPAAVPTLREAAGVLREALPPGHPELARALDHLGAALRIAGELAEARPLLEEALAIRLAVLGDAHPDLGYSYFELALLERDGGDLPAALGWLEQCLAVRRRIHPETHPELIGTEFSLGAALSQLGRNSEAIELLEARLARLEELGEEDLAAAVRSRLEILRGR